MESLWAEHQQSQMSVKKQRKLEVRPCLQPAQEQATAGYSSTAALVLPVAAEFFLNH